MARTVRVPLRLPQEAMMLLQKLAEQKILGETVEEVAMHILRESIFERFTIVRAKLEKAK